MEYGITLDGIWLPLAMLRRLGTHGPWDPPFTEATADQERVLLAHLLAERHNQAGLHRGLSLPNLLDAIPFQPTASFGKISGGERTHVRPGRIRGGPTSEPDRTLRRFG